MKKQPLIIAILIITLTNVVAGKHKMPDTTTKFNIAFIIAQEENNAYAKQALSHYLNRKDVEIVTHCTSLQEIFDHLHQISKSLKNPINKIEIIAHGNPWTGLSIPISKSIRRTTVDGLLSSIDDNTLVALENSILSRSTQIKIKACGVGNNPELLESISYAFGGFDDQRPNVTSSKFFVQYVSDANEQTREYQFKPYYAFYKTAYRPTYSILANDFSRQYPESKINWLDHLLSEPSPDSDIQINRFNVPVQWYTKIPQNFNPNNFTEDQDKINLVRSESGLMKILETHSIPVEKFRWTIIDTPDKDPKTILIKGKATVICILQKLNATI